MAYRQPKTGEALGGTATVEPEAATGIKNPPDTHIWGVYGFLIVLSVIELYSASSFEISKQGLYSPLVRHVSMLFVGFLIILGLQRVHYKYFIQAGWVIFIGSALAMLYVMAFGEVVNGAKRAISLPFMTLQPAEFLKLSAVLMLSYILGTTQLKKDETKRNKGLIKATILTLILCGLLFTQGLTNTAILCCICVSMLVVGALEARKFWMIMGVFCLFGAAAMGVKMAMSSGDEKAPETVLVDPRGQVFNIPDGARVGGGEAGSRLKDDTWENRFTAFTDTTPRYMRPITPKNLQEMRSYMAQANGGWVGVFPGNSRETSRLPLAFSDFIFAIIVEDLGFIGAMFIMLLYIWLLARAYIIAYRCNQMYPAFLVTGCALLITLQALCHMAIVSGAGPVSGQPLPLFSKGGTSILVTSIAFGIMLSVSRFTLRDANASRAEKAAEKAALPDEIRIDNPSQIHG